MLYIFDLDGTLVDSIEKIVTCLGAAIIERGLPYRSNDQLKEVIGLAMPDVVSRLYGAIGDREAEALRDSYVRYFVEVDQRVCTAYPGVDSTLEALRAQGHSLAIATSKSRKGLQAVLSDMRWEGLFDAVRCSGEALFKPDPMMLNQLLEEFSLAPDEAVMIGDTEFDLIMASRAFVPSIAVTYGAHSKERLMRHAPVLCLDQFEDILLFS